MCYFGCSWQAVVGFMCLGDDVRGGDVVDAVVPDPAAVAAQAALGIGELVVAEEVDSGVVGDAGALSSDIGGGVQQPDAVLEDEFVGLGAL